MNWDGFSTDYLPSTSGLILVFKALALLVYFLGSIGSKFGRIGGPRRHAGTYVIFRFSAFLTVIDHWWFLASFSHFNIIAIA